jgi:predicted transcriptional regulator
MELLLRKKQAAVFLFLKSQEEPVYLTQIARETSTTYVYITNFVSLLAERGLVSVVPRTKKKLVRLTEKGKEVSVRIEALREALE